MIVGSVVLAVPLAAHDFWIAASDWRVNPGATVTITANVGDDSYPVSQNATAPERVESLRLIGPTSSVSKPVFRILGDALAADVVLPTQAGTYMAVLTVKGRFLSMAPKEFETYLKEEGLDGVLADRTRRQETDVPSRERYSRQAKTLIRAGAGSSAHVTRPAEIVAELVPDTDLTQARSGDDIAVRLLFEGRPVANAQVSAYGTGAAPIQARRQTGRTDANGRVHFKLRGAGPYLLTTTHMVRRTGETGPEAVDWESYWVSITFSPLR